MYRTVVIAALLLGVVVAGAACGDDDDDGGEERAQRSTTTAPSVEADVEAAYLAYSEMFQRLVEMPDPSDPEIEERATGAAASSLVEHLEVLVGLGQAVRFGAKYRAETMSLDIAGGEAVLQECVVDDADVIAVATDEVVESTPVATVQNRVTLSRDGGLWRVSEVQQEAGWRGISGCAA
jgi:hypothetical protein